MEAGRVLAGRYELEHQIGSGGAAVVWRATDRSLERPVAIKVLRAGMREDGATIERFRREAQSAAALNHPNAVAIYDIGEEEGEVFIVMELVSGPALDELMEGPLAPELVVAVGFQVASALGLAHRQGLIHRDVKPANILIGTDGLAKVADFGIAKAIDAAHTTLTRTGTVVGTVAYLAPEQIRGDDVDARADVYALGLVMHQALTGEMPFGTGTPAEITARRLATDPPSLGEVRPDLPHALASTITKASRQDPGERFDDGAAFAAALEDLLADDPQQLVRRLATAEPHPRRGDETRPLEVQTDHLDDTVAIPLDPRDGTDSESEPASDGADEEPTPDQPSEEPTSREATRNEPGPDEPPRDSTVRVPPILPESDEDRPDPLIPDDVKRPVLAVIAVAAVILVAMNLFGGSGGDGSNGGGAPDDEDRGPRAVEVAAASDFDPHGNDGEEHREDVPAAYDGDPATQWTTERYDSADMGGLKPGVGIWFDLGAPRELSSVELTLGGGTSNLEVYVGDQEPSGTEPASWGTQIAMLEGASETASIEVPSDVAGRYVLVWITSVGGAGERAEIAEARFLAR